MDQELEEIIALAKAGRTAYQIELGSAYLAGTTVAGHTLPLDFDQAKRWLELAHDKGAFTATYILGTMHEEGKGVITDIPQAISLYERAAERGSYLACVHLARIYAQGKGVPKDSDLAHHWYDKVLSFEGKVDDQGEMREAHEFLRR